MLTQEELKTQLHYDPDTGVFTWLGSKRGRKCYQEAGSVSGENSYRGVMIAGKQYLAHRLAFLYMEGAFPPEHVDHINHLRWDNRWCNLRMVTPAINHRNASRGCNNTSGYTGVSFDKARNRYKAIVHLNGRNKYLGRFRTLAEAVMAREAASALIGYHPNHGGS